MSPQRFLIALIALFLAVATQSTSAVFSDNADNARVQLRLRELKASAATCKTHFAKSCNTPCAGQKDKWHKFKCQMGCYKTNFEILGKCPRPALSVQVAKVANCSDVVTTLCSDCQAEEGMKAIACYASCSRTQGPVLGKCKKEERCVIPGQPPVPFNCSQSIQQACPACFRSSLPITRQLSCIDDCVDEKEIEDCRHFQRDNRCLAPLNVTEACPECFNEYEYENEYESPRDRIQCQLDCISEAEWSDYDDDDEYEYEYESPLGTACLFPGIDNLVGWTDKSAGCLQALKKNCVYCSWSTMSAQDQADCYTDCMDDQDACSGDDDDGDDDDDDWR